MGVTQIREVFILTSSIQYQATLDVLIRKRSELSKQLETAEISLENLKKDMDAEKADVERLEEESFMTSLLKLLRLHEGKLTKESEEYLKAKLTFERQTYEVAEMSGQLTNLERRIVELTKESETYQKTLSSRLTAFQNMAEDSPNRVLYNKMSEKERLLKAECTEIEEAIEACRRAINTKNEAMGLLESAESWASWDAWAGGGLITDMVKYDKLDAVQVAFKHLTTDLNHLKREMADIGDTVSLELSNIDSATKFFDIWFDNFFTDMKVKAQVHAQIEALKVLSSELSKLCATLDYRYQVATGDLKASIEAIEAIVME